MYSLLTIIRYRGTGNAGHWWINIRDFKNNCWRSYNDAKVEIILDSDVFSTTKEMHTPLLAYVRDDRKDQLIDPLHRIKPENSVGEHEDDNDVAMGEFDALRSGVALPTNSGWPLDSKVEVQEIYREVEMKSLLDD